MSLVLHGSPLSQPTRMVMWTLKLLGMPYEFKRVDAGKGEQKTPAFLKLNPNAVFPVLVQNSGAAEEYVLYESNAICRYLVSTANHHPLAQQLYPSDAKTRALVDQWLDWKHGALREGAAGVVRRQVMAKMVGKAHSMFQTFDEVKPERELRLLKHALGVLEAQLGRSEFIVADKPTLADIAVFEEVEQLALLPSKPAQLPLGRGEFAKDFPRIAAWQAKMRKALPDFVEVHKELLGAAKKLEEMRNQPPPANKL